MGENDEGTIMLNMFTGDGSDMGWAVHRKKDGRTRLKEKKKQKKVEKRIARFERKKSSHVIVLEHEKSDTTQKVKGHDHETKERDAPRRTAMKQSSWKSPGSGSNKMSSLFRHNPEIPDVKSDDVEPKVEPVFSSQNFSDLKIHPHLVSSLENNFEISKMTSVQKLSIPSMLKGKDALVKSQTGTGKTLAYAIPMAESLQSVEPKIQRSDGPYAVVLLPTRELALQSYEVIQKLMKPFQWIVPGYMIGGEKRKSEKARIRKGINILVSTPGRLVDHLKNTETMKLCKVKWLVLDEADRLLDLGMERDVTVILNALNEQAKTRQTVLLSATLTEGVKNLAGISMNDPVHVNVTHSQLESSKSQADDYPSSDRTPTSEGISEEDFCTPEQLKQHFLIVPSKLRLVTLAAFILWQCKYAGQSKMLVFLSSRDSVEFHHNLFQSILNSEDDDDDEEDIDFFQLHGNMSQDERTRVYHSFVESTSGVLLCTDVAARGLDLPGVKWIVQYNTPGTSAEYIHRVGRTARIGKEGQALLFLAPSEVEYVKILNSHKLSLNEMDMQKILKTLLLYSNEQHSHPKKLQMTPQNVEECATSLQAKFENFVGNDRGHTEQARKAYLSFIRAYATYPTAFKHIFHIKMLHLGHVAKSFALRETPTSVGHISTKMHQKEQKRKGSGQKRQGSSPLKNVGVKRSRLSMISEFSSGLDARNQLVMNKFAAKSAKTRTTTKKK